MRKIALFCLLAGLAIGPVYGVYCGMQTGEPVDSCQFDLKPADNLLTLVENSDQPADSDKQPTFTANFRLTPEMTPVRLMATARFPHEVGERKRSVFAGEVRRVDGHTADTKLIFSMRGLKLTKDPPDGMLESTRLLKVLDIDKPGEYTVTLRPEAGNTLMLSQLTIVARRNAARLHTPIVMAGGLLMLIGFGLYLRRVEPQVREVLSSLDSTTGNTRYGL